MKQEKNGVLDTEEEGDQNVKWAERGKGKGTRWRIVPAAQESW
jgi:hypothetical protein